MAKDLFAKYMWLLDTLSRYQRLTRQEIDNLWRESEISGGDPMPKRTFYHYRRNIEENFNIIIDCDSNGRYFIDKGDSARARAMSNWFLDSYALSSVFKDSSIPSDRIDLEEIPSARQFLTLVLEAIKKSNKINFSYKGFNRSRTETDIIFSPYYLKLYKQRWYMVGLKEKGKTIRTYALDRITEMNITGDTFRLPDEASIDSLFGNIIGVTTSHADTRKVVLKVSPMQAKYFRALPFHPSQEEMIHDNYSIFTFDLKLNFELVHEILALGDAVKVEAPPELKIMVTEQLRAALSQYE